MTKEYREYAKSRIEYLLKICRLDERDKEALETAIKALSQEPCDDTVSRGAFEQVMWERDIAIEQLHELGYELGQKIEPCDDIAQERYKDLCEYFGGAKDILKSREDFKAWLGRVKWHIHKAEELYEKYEYKQEPCDDAVSRLDKIRQIIAIPNSVIQEDVMKYQMICELLKDELPSVTQKSGKWHRKHDSIVNDWLWECDKCSCGYQHEYNYCPNCGAKMESEDKE